VERIGHQNSLHGTERPRLDEISRVRVDARATTIRWDALQRRAIAIDGVNDAARREHVRQSHGKGPVAAAEIRPGHRPECLEAAPAKHCDGITDQHPPDGSG
jgi:hypothetical protein